MVFIYIKSNIDSKKINQSNITKTPGTWTNELVRKPIVNSNVFFLTYKKSECPTTLKTDQMGQKENHHWKNMLLACDFHHYFSHKLCFFVYISSCRSSILLFWWKYILECLIASLSNTIFLYFYVFYSIVVRCETRFWKALPIVISV